MRTVGALVCLLVSCAPAAPSRGPVGSSSAKSTESSVKDVEAAPAVATTHRISSESWNTCAVLADGRVSCWGAGAIVEIPQGLKGLAAAARPAVIAGLDDAVEVVTLTGHACARKKTSEVACWGVGKIGALALDRTHAALVPGMKVDRLTKLNGAICGTTATELVCQPFDARPLDHEPLPVKSSEIVELAGADRHVCLLTGGGAVHCKGDDTLGAVGGKSAGWVHVKKIEDAVHVAVADNYSCAVHATGARSCWGNGHGIYEKSDGEERYPVVTDRIRTGFARAALGRFQCWVERDRTVQCEGHAEHGEHGAGKPSGYGAQKVAGLADAIDVVVGFEHACALRANGEVQCWGANDYAQVGDGTLIDRTVPTGVLGLGGKEPLATPKPGTGPALTLSTTGGAKADWREPDGGMFSRIDAGYGHFDRTEPDAFGVRAAIFRARGMAIHANHGLVPLTFPAGTTFVGLDGDDAVWIGTKDALLRAPDVLAAKKGSYQKVLSLPFAVGFATTVGMVVAADARSVRITRDGGKTFKTVTLKADVSIERVFARADGLIAVQGNDKAGDRQLLLAKDGATFVPSNFNPMGLQSSGGLLFANGCPGGLLSSDGVTWNRWERDYGTALDASGWGSALTVGSYPSVFDSSRLPTLAVMPPAPAVAITDKPVLCQGGGGVGAIGWGGGRFRRRAGGACVGVACIRASVGDLPKTTKTEFGLYADGACDRDAKGRCVAPFKRQPHAWSSASGVLELPAGCDALRLLSAGGIGVLFCAKDDKLSSVYTIGSSGKWMDEGTVAAFPIDVATIAEDGTLVVHPKCGDDGGLTGLCAKALVRAPVALGQKTAWRATAQGYAYRALPGGAVLVIAGSVNEVVLSIDKATGVTPFGPKLGLLTDLVDVELKKDRVVLVHQMTTRKERRAYVAADGLVDEP